MTFENIIAFIKKHKAMLGLGAIGLEIAFLMLVIGFFRTLLLVVLTLLFGVYGYFIDKLGFRGVRIRQLRTCSGANDEFAAGGLCRLRIFKTE